MKNEIAYIYTYPTNTRDAEGIVLRHSIQVKCPYCDGNHYHNKAAKYMLSVEAPCGRGRYVIKVKGA